MKSDRLYVDHLEDIRNSVEQATQFVESMNYEEFKADAKTSFAVIRALEVIGEASKNIPDGVREQYPSVPWRQMAGMRDKLIHHYFGVNLEVVWKTVTEHLPKLKPQLDEIVEKEKRDEKDGNSLVIQ